MDSTREGRGVGVLSGPGIRRASGRTVLLVAALAPLAVMGSVAAAYAVCRWRSLPGGLMRACGDAALSSYLWAAVGPLRLPVLTGLAVGLTLLASERARAEEGPPRRGPVVLAAAAGFGAGLPHVLDATREGMTTGALDFLWLSIDRFWDRRTIYTYFDGCIGDASVGLGLTLECNGYVQTYPVLFGPFAALPPGRAFAVWAVVNAVLTLLVGIGLGIGFRLSPIAAFALSALLAHAATTENVILNGQTSLAVLALVVVLPLLARRRAVVPGVLAGLGMFKVSLFLPFLGLLLVARTRLALWSVGTIAGAALFAAAWLPAPRLETLLAPLVLTPRVIDSVSYGGMASGDLHRLVAELGVLVGPVGSLLLGLVSVAVPAVLFRRTGDPLVGVAAASLSALILFPHLTYDYVFAAPVLAFALSRLPGLVAALLAVISSVLLLWPPRAVGGLLDRVSPDASAVLLEAFRWPISGGAAMGVLVLNLAALVAVWYLGTSGQRAARAAPPAAVPPAG